jgi:hypothetical protein
LCASTLALISANDSPCVSMPIDRATTLRSCGV